MKKVKLYSIIGAIFVIITGTISHFIYEWSGRNFILGFFFPVSESTWEHMKLCFFPMLIYSFFMKKQLQKEFPCITSSLLFGTLFGTLLIPIIFYTYTGILGRHFLVLDILTFILSVIFAFISVYKLILTCKMNSFAFVLGLLVFFMAVFFFIFTYMPPDIGIFINPSQ